MHKVVFSIGTLALILLAVTIWLIRPTSSLATRTVAPTTTTSDAYLDTSNTKSPAVAPAVTCDPVWTQIASPTAADLHAVAAITAYDAWAVGDGGFFRWNGTSWNSVTVPMPAGAVSLSMQSIASRQASDIWAGGSYSDGTYNNYIVYHWDGVSWSIIFDGATQESIGLSNTITGITPVGPGEAIAVGIASAAGPPIYRCNALSTCIFMENSLGYGGFRAVDFLSSSNVWAVGFNGGATLIAHYGGNSWEPVIAPDVGPLYGVTVIAPNDVWSVGGSTALHWDGTLWTTFSIDVLFSAVASTASNSIWAVGYNSTGTAIWYWNGTSWIPQAQLGSTFLNGVSARASNDVWVVGDGGYISRYAAPQQFEDVQLGSTFYSFVQDLSCRAIIAGYTCGSTGEPCVAPNNLSYFRPTANVTRGQLSKIIILASGLPTPAQNQTFEDVPIGSTFHPYVEALAFQNAIGGYPCGGPGEPCGPTNKPYFRPNVTSTRGQTSKIVAITAGYTDPFQSQTFEDVPTDSTFYLWIENLASRSIINGYPCGGSGEPCVVPNNRPYFRAANNVTRGQMSKIAVITFTP